MPSKQAWHADEEPVALEYKPVPHITQLDKPVMDAYEPSKQGKQLERPNPEV